MLNKIRRTILQSLELFMKSPKATSPLDSFTVWLHSSFTFVLFIMVYQMLSSMLPESEEVKCYSHGGGLDELQDTLKLDACMSYSYCVVQPEGKPERTEYTVNYPYIPFSFLACAALLYIVNFIRMMLADIRLESFFKEIDRLSETEISNFFLDYIVCQRGLVYGRFTLVFLCVISNLGIIYLLEFVSSRTLLRIPLFYPFTRDAGRILNDLHGAFPSFTLCTFTPLNALAIGNTENYGCHFSKNIHYEKVFIVLFLYLCLLWLFTVTLVSWDLFQLWKCWNYKGLDIIICGPGNQHGHLRKIMNSFPLDLYYNLRILRASASAEVYHHVLEDIMSYMEVVKVKFKELPNEDVS